MAARRPKIAPNAAPPRAGEQTAPIRVPKTAEVVAGRIRKAIVNGDLRTGDSLPAEAQLIAQYGVSRPTLREAIRILESERLITVARGARGGAKITRPTFEIVAQAAGVALQTKGVTVADLYEARTLIEPPAARLAAKRAPKRASAALRKHLDYERAVMDDLPAVTQAIADFHRILLEECGNVTLSVVGLALHGVVERHMALVQRVRPRSAEERARQLRFGLKSHEKLITLIESGDAAGAEKHWLAHMEAAAKHWAGDLGPTRLDIMD
jgi:DNA-binding FadR family transcriptional regulator